MRWILLLLVVSSGAVAQESDPGLSPAWQNAVELTEAGKTTEAIAALVSLERRLRADPTRPMAQLSRYYILQNLSRAQRYPEVIARLGMVRPGDLPNAFRHDLVRVEAEARLETGDAGGARTLLDSVRSPTGRMELLRGRALAELGQSEAARDAIADGLISADDASPREKQKAIQVLTAVLEASGRLGEAERMERLAAQVYGKPAPGKNSRTDR